MNDDDPLDPISHVTKLVKNPHVYEEAIVDGEALRPRPDEEYMSVNWLEFDGDSDLDMCLKKIIAIYVQEKKMNVKDNNWLPVINVQKAIDYIKAESLDKRVLQFLYKPELKPEYLYDDPSHSGVYGYSYEDAMIGDLMMDVVESLHKAKDYK